MSFFFNSVIVFLSTLLARVRQYFFLLTLDKNQKDLVIFFIPSVEKINGGILSIFTLAEDTRRVCPEKLVLLVTTPARRTYFKNRFFKNKERILSFVQLPSLVSECSDIWFHIPEYCFLSVTREISKKLQSLPEASNVRINLLNQNIELMPRKQEVKKIIREYQGFRFSQTTAHSRYSSQEVCDDFGLPLSKFSVRLNKPIVPPTPFEEKTKKLLVCFSPDLSEYSEILQKKLSLLIPSLTVEIIQNLSFDEYYKKLSQSFVVITFGEGFDGYFTQPFDVNSIGISVYNPNFFPSDKWRNLPNVFDSFEQLILELPSLIVNLLGDEEQYTQLVMLNQKMLSTEYDTVSRFESIAKFYRDEFDYYPNNK